MHISLLSELNVRPISKPNPRIGRVLIKHNHLILNEGVTENVCREVSSRLHRAIASITVKLRKRHDTTRNTIELVAKEPKCIRHNGVAWNSVAAHLAVEFCARNGVVDRQQRHVVQEHQRRSCINDCRMVRLSRCRCQRATETSDASRRILCG